MPSTSTPKPVATRQAALIESLGFASNDVPADGVTRDGITVLLTAWQTNPTGAAQVTVAADGVPVVSIPWETDEQREDAARALWGDVAETVLGTR